VRLFRAVKAHGQAERVLQHAENGRILADRCHGRLEARRGAAGEGALHLADAALDARYRRAEAFFCGLLGEPDAEIERDRVEAAGKHNARTAGLGGALILSDHLVHPGRLAAQIDIIGPRIGAG